MLRKSFCIVALFVVVGLSLAVVLSGCGGIPPDAAATVDGNVITKDKVKSGVALYYLMNARQAQNIDTSSLIYQTMQAQILDQLVTEELDKTEAQKRGLSVSDAEIDAQEDQLLEDEYLGSSEALQKDLDKSGVTEADLRDEFYRGLLHQKILDSLRAEITVTDDDVRPLYESHLSQYVYPETRQIRQVVVADEATAQSVADRISAGEDMGTIARQLSIDQKTKQIGGRIDPVTKDKLPGTVGDAAFSLPVMQVSAPLESDLGWYVIRVEVINPSANMSFDQVKADLIKQETDNRMNERYKEYGDQVKADTDIQYAPDYDPAKTLTSTVSA